MSFHSLTACRSGGFILQQFCIPLTPCPLSPQCNNAFAQVSLRGRGLFSCQGLLQGFARSPLKTARIRARTAGASASRTAHDSTGQFSGRFEPTGSGDANAPQAPFGRSPFGALPAVVKTLSGAIIFQIFQLMDITILAGSRPLALTVSSAFPGSSPALRTARALPRQAENVPRV